MLDFSCLQVFAAINNAGMSSLTHKSLSASPNASPGQLPRRWIPGPKGVNIFQAQGTHSQTALQKERPGRHVHQQLRQPTSLARPTTSERISFILAHLQDGNDSSFLFRLHYSCRQIFENTFLAICSSAPAICLFLSFMHFCCCCCYFVGTFKKYIKDITFSLYCKCSPQFFTAFLLFINFYR